MPADDLAQRGQIVDAHDVALARAGSSPASRAANRIAAIKLDGSARPVPAISNAVPWSGDERTNGSPNVTFTVRPRQNPGANYGSTDQPDVISSQNYQNQQTYNVQQFTQYAYVRIRGRQMAFKISSADLGVSWQLGSPRLDVRSDGRR